MKNPLRIDKTRLSLDEAEDRCFIHRDYIAHCFRWSHACRVLDQNKAKWKNAANILDVGCGGEVPFSRLLYTGKMECYFSQYVGIDAGIINPNKVLRRPKHHYYEKTRLDEYAHYEWSPHHLITCFEVLEHMPLWDAYQSLKYMYNMLEEDGILLMSTPNYSGQAAANHVNEMTYSLVSRLLILAGFEFSSHGTFAKQSMIKDELYRMGLGATFQCLHAYYDNNVLSTIFAPLFPKLSSNVMYTCKIGRHVPLIDKIELAKKILTTETCVSSQPEWQKDAQQIINSLELYKGPSNG
jgi:2-polyprenyl-3-methyl-5-hydroxy-6-metoxy-1,4-benzoquinol methylase